MTQLYTHASLTFENPCLGLLEYEATAAAIFMAGLFITFLGEYVGHRFTHQGTHRAQDEHGPHSPVSIYVLEAGIIFHSISKFDR